MKDQDVMSGYCPKCHKRPTRIEDVDEDTPVKERYFTEECLDCKEPMFWIRDRIYQT